MSARSSSSLASRSTSEARVRTSWKDSPARLRDGEPLRSDRRVERVEHLADELLGGRVGQDPVGRRGEVALEAGALREVQPGVVLEQALGRVLDQVVERLDVHLQGQGLELGGHLLQPEALADPDGDRLVLGHQQGGDHLVRGHVLAQDEGARLELAVQLAVGGDEDERPGVAQETLVGQALADRRRRVAVEDRELDVTRVGAGRLGQDGSEILADEVGHERQTEGARVIGRPADDGAGDHRPEDRSARRPGRDRRGSPGRA